ncbi:hypothetical protein [Bradyrhizobium sp. SZCCHNS3053]|uniref:hypothetical protein n=1 Tax=Bradyrhizobium sp. SZCCHNS3053 TaxID=3057322 RepID=UPI0029164FF4|nr:hypothetical protein [Bradyrhizobium sp. SZCCHNS3053]
MAEKMPVSKDEGLPGAPPLFVTAFSKEGKRYEELLESGQPAPKWFNSAPYVRVQAPSGEVTDGVLSGDGPDDPYEKCLWLFGAKRAWAPEVLEMSAAGSVASLELWTNEEGATSVSEGTVLTLRRPTDGTTKIGKGLFASDGKLSCYAVIRRKDKTTVHVPNAGRFYLDVLSLDDGLEAVPRALLDTSLAGAFWGFTEHQNPAAAERAAKRLLSVIFDNPAKPPPAPWIAAAAHAVLAHRSLLPIYGDRVLKLLATPEAPAPDAEFLRAVVGMAQLGLGKGDADAVKQDVRAAIFALARHRATYGETVRWLDMKFTVLRELALREFKDDGLKEKLDAVAEWLRTSYAGGQIAAYVGEAPIPKGLGWHDVLAQKKKNA